MLIHSVMPNAWIMQDANQPQLECRSYNGRYLEGRTENGEFIVNRVISTDPKAYLDTKVTIGAVLPREQRNQ